MNSKKKVIFLMLILGFSQMFSFSLMKINAEDNLITVPPTFGTKNSFDSIIEDFSNTTFNEASETNITGWGTGAIFGTRNISFNIMDYVSTTSAVYGVAVQGQKGYLACYDGATAIDSVVTMDFSDLSNLQQLGARSSLTELRESAIAGDYMYCTRRLSPTGYIASYNVSNPYNIGASGMFLGSTPTEANTSDLDIEGHYLYYVCDNYASPNDNLGMISIRDPSNPVHFLMGWSDYRLKSIDVVGNIAYILSEFGLHILDITNRKNAIELSFLPLPGTLLDVEVQGNYAFIAAGYEGVLSVFVGNPYNPVLVDVFGAIPSGAGKIAVQDSSLYVAAGPSGVGLLDITNPNEMLLVTGTALSGIMTNLAFYGGEIIAVGTAGVFSLSITPPGTDGYIDLSTTTYYGEFSDLSAWDVRVEDNIAYVAGGRDGFYTLDVSDPYNVQLLDHFPAATGDIYRKMDYEGGFAYCVDYNWVYVFDVRDPTNIILAEMISGADMTDIFVDGHIAYISYGNYTNTQSGVGINNVTDPYNWNYITGFNFGTNITAIWVEGTHLYAVDYVAPSTYVTSFYCYDLRDYTSIQLTESVTRLATHLDIYASGDFAYLSTEKYLTHYNISNPTFFTFEGDLHNQTAQPIVSSGVWGYGRNFISVGSDGVYYLKYDPILETFVSSHFQRGKKARQVFIFGDYAFVANTDSLIILRHHYSGSDSFVNNRYQAQSTPVVTLSEGKLISVTLEIDAQMTILCPTTFYASADNGTHWEEVIPGNPHTFVYQGQNLKWKIVMKTDQKLSNRFYTLRINYEFSLPPDGPTINDLGGSSIWGYKKVTWTPASDDGSISYYVLQVSTDATFTTLHKNYTVTGTSQGVYYMPKGYYHFRVRGVDNTGLLGDWSAVAALDVTFSLLSPMWLGIIGGGLIAIIAIITVTVIVVRKKKKALPER